MAKGLGVPLNDRPMSTEDDEAVQEAIEDYWNLRKTKKRTQSQTELQV